MRLAWQMAGLAALAPAIVAAVVGFLYDPAPPPAPVAAPERAGQTPPPGEPLDERQGDPAAGRAPPAAPSPAVDRYDRPPARVVRSQIRNIIGQRQGSSEPSLLDRLLRWLHRLLRGRSGAAFDWPWWQWLIVIWCGGTLIAILVHLIWSIVGAFRGSRAGPAPAEPGVPHFERLRTMTLDELLGAARAAANERRYREAVHWLMLALLRNLDAHRLVRLDPSKTNGEYLREYPADRQDRSALRRFVVGFDRVVYASAPCDARHWREFESLYREIGDHANPEP